MFGNIGPAFTHVTPRVAAPPQSIGTDFETVTINSTYIPTDITGFVVSLDMSLLSSTFFTNMASGGSVRVTLDDGTTEIPYHLIYLDTTNSKGYIKVKMDVSGSSDSIFKIYSGNNLSDYASSATYGRNNVYTSNYTMYHPLHTTPDLTQVNAVGDTNLDMTSVGGMLSTDVVTAAYGGGNAPLITGASSQGFSVSDTCVSSYPFTMGCWYRTPNDELDNGFIFTVAPNDGTTGTADSGLRIFGLKSYRSFYAYNGSIVEGSIAYGVQSTSWRYVIGIFTSSTSRQLYYNGSFQTVNTQSFVLPTCNKTTIGFPATASPLYFTGELAVQDVFSRSDAMSTDEATAMYNNYTQAGFFTVT